MRVCRWNLRSKDHHRSQTKPLTLQIACLCPAQANNRPAALLNTLEPPRGLHYFPMERFRQSWHRSPANGGFRRFSGGGGGGGSDGSMNADDLRILPSKGRHAPSDPFNTPSVAGGRSATAGAGMASFSPAGGAPQSGAGTPYAQSGVGGGRSSPGSSTVTPIQQGFSMFGGKAFSTPASGDRPRPPLDFSTQVDDTPVGSSGPRQGGISRFKTLTQQTTQQEEEEEEDDKEETKGRRSRSRHAARALLSPSAELSQHTSMMGSPPIPSQVASPPPFGGPIGGSFGHGYSTPAPVAPCSSTTAAGDATAVTMTGPSDRKRSRQPNATSTSTNSRTTAPSVPAERASATRKPPMGDAQRDASAYASQARQERAWGSISRGGAQHGEDKSPRVTATRGGGTGVAGGTPKSSSRSPRAKTKSPSRSPRAARGGSSQHASQGPTPPPRRYTLADFAGADEVCFNAGEGALAASSV